MKCDWISPRRRPILGVRSGGTQFLLILPLCTVRKAGDGGYRHREEQAIYSKILKISPHKSAPTHYELLGISPDEQDPKRIQAAMRERMEQLRRGASPDLLRAARVVLKKIERAETCLLDAQARASYDVATGSKGTEAAASSIWDELEAPAAPSSVITPEHLAFLKLAHQFINQLV